MLVHPHFLSDRANDESNPRVQVRHARLDRRFGPGNWTEVFVDLVHGGGTVLDQNGDQWDWWPVGKGSFIEAVPAR
jgi:hypothetical protein